MSNGVSSIGSASTPNALSILTGPNGPLSNLPFQIPQNVLQSASPTDLAEISVEAQKLAAANILFGNSTSSSSPFGDPIVNNNSEFSVLGSIYGVPPPNSTPTSASQQLASAMDSTTTIPMGTSPSDQYLLSLAGSNNSNRSVTNVTG